MNADEPQSTARLDDQWDEDCPFCAIGRGEDGSISILCEDEAWIAFFPLEPATPGHTLVIPRSHFPDLWSVNFGVAGALMEAAIQVGRAIMSVLEPEGMNLISSSGGAAEQTVFHAHLHLVPRWNADGFGPIWPLEAAGTGALEPSLVERIRAACATT